MLYELTCLLFNSLYIFYVGYRSSLFSMCVCMYVVYVLFPDAVCARAHVIHYTATVM